VSKRPPSPGAHAPTGIERLRVNFGKMARSGANLERTTKLCQDLPIELIARHADNQLKINSLFSKTSWPRPLLQHFRGAQRRNVKSIISVSYIEYRLPDIRGAKVRSVEFGWIFALGGDFRGRGFLGRLTLSRAYSLTGGAS
jgi:hypothetical protein